MQFAMQTVGRDRGAQMACFGTKFEQNRSAYSSQKQEKAERQQKTSLVQFCSNLVPNHFTGLSVAPRFLADRVHYDITNVQNIQVPYFLN